jgi:hypothetical protein
MRAGSLDQLLPKEIIFELGVDRPEKSGFVVFLDESENPMTILEVEDEHKEMITRRQ